MKKSETASPVIYLKSTYKDFLQVQKEGKSNVQKMHIANLEVFKK